MTQASQNILVTGGAGYIGSHTCKLLSEHGYTPVSYDNLVYGHTHAVKWGPLEVGELADTERLAHVIETYAPAAVIHFAAYALVGESVVDPAKYYRNNVLGTLSLLDTMRAFQLDKIVFSSTCATYGVPAHLPICESTPQNPINPYGKSKLMIEQVLADYDTAYDLKSVCLRYFNACGADRDGDIGEEHEPETHLIPNILRSLTGSQQKLSIFGTDYDTPDGTCIRDYIHVEDLAEGHLLALKYLFDGGASDVFNLGTGQGFSVMEVVAAVERVTGLSVPRELAPRRPGDPPVLTADVAKVKEQLGFQAKVSDIDTIVASAWNFHQKQRA